MMLPVKLHGATMPISSRHSMGNWGTISTNELLLCRGVGGAAIIIKINI